MFKDNSFYCDRGLTKEKKVTQMLGFLFNDNICNLSFSIHPYLLGPFLFLDKPGVHTVDYQ